MSTNMYTCPCCGAPLSFSGETGKVECASCGNAYEADALKALRAEGVKDKISFDMSKETLDGSDVRGYICKGCGAELMTDATTTATECPYCGNPTVLPDRIEGGIKPAFVVPFVVTQEQATDTFANYFKGKKLMPNVFLNSKNRISEMRKLYVPYWLFDCEADARMTFEAEKVHTERRGEWEIKTTEHYLLHREGSLGFNSIPVDGSEKLDDRITESLEPYNLTKAVPFRPAVLAGAMADNADVDAEVCEKRAVQRVETSVERALRDTVHGYTNVRVRSRSIRTRDGKATPALMPVWLITTEKNEGGKNKTYTFAINGQTGKLTTDVKPDAKKSFVWGAGVFAAVMLLAVLLMAVMDSLESGIVMLSVIISLLAAFITVAVLRGQLKTAAMQASASNYVRSGSFELYAKFDHFLYRHVDRRRIEQPNHQQQGGARPPQQGGQRPPQPPRH